MKKLILIISFFLFSSGYGFCGPSSAIKFLMNDSVSMLDWGCYRMEEKLNKILSSTGVAPGSGAGLGGTPKFKNLTYAVKYNWKSNQIIVSSKIFNMMAQDKDELKKDCINLTEDIKFNIQLYEMVYFFHHGGYQNGHEPKRLFDKLVDCISIQITAEGIAVEKSIFSKSDYTDEKIYFSESTTTY